MKISLCFILIATCVVFVRSAYAQHHGRHSCAITEKELQELSTHGMTYRFIDEETIELTQLSTGFKRIKTLKEPDEYTLKNFAKLHDIPLLEIDPTLVDTMKYTNWYKWWARVPLMDGVPYPIGDVDHNGKPELYGSYTCCGLDFMSKAYEVDSIGTVTFLYEYLPRMGAALQLTDVDQNGLKEIVFQLGDSSFFYEQSSIDSLPIHRKFAHAKYEYPGTAIGTVETVADMDNDSLADYVYRGSEWDSTHTYSILKTYVAEYDHSLGNFKKIWSTQLWPPESGIGGYDIGDYDGDGKMNFLATGLWGQIWVVENDSDNSYAVNWKDSIPYVNLFYQTSGDVDGDGKREFFVSATMSSGNWITVYETTGDNSFRPTFQFHLLSGGTGDEPTLITRDMTGDGKPELLILSGPWLYIFTSRSDNTYELWYLKKNEAKQGVQTYDFDHDGKMDFIIAKTIVEQYGLRDYSDIFVARDIPTQVKEPEPLPRETKLLQNYPNPFNPVTTIRFQLHIRSRVTMKIYDLLGREIATVIDQKKEAGTYMVEWIPPLGLTSGVYFCTMEADGYRQTVKMLFMK